MKPNVKTADKINQIKENLFEFVAISRDQHISSFCATLDRLSTHHTEIKFKKKLNDSYCTNILPKTVALREFRADSDEI